MHNFSQRQIEREAEAYLEHPYGCTDMPLSVRDWLRKNVSYRVEVKCYGADRKFIIRHRGRDEFRQIPLNGQAAALKYLVGQLYMTMLTINQVAGRKLYTVQDVLAKAHYIIGCCFTGLTPYHYMQCMVEAERLLQDPVRIKRCTRPHSRLSFCPLHVTGIMECLEKYVWLCHGFDKASRRGFKAYAMSVGKYFTKPAIYEAFDRFPQAHRRDFGKHHSPHKGYKPRKAQCLEGVKVRDGVALVPFGSRVSQTLRNYCCRHKLKIRRIIVAVAKAVSGVLQQVRGILVTPAVRGLARLWSRPAGQALSCPGPGGGLCLRI